MGGKDYRIPVERSYSERKRGTGRDFNSADNSIPAACMLPSGSYLIGARIPFFFFFPSSMASLSAFRGSAGWVCRIPLGKAFHQ